MPTFINSFPQFTDIIPQVTQTGANLAAVKLSARKKPTVVTAYKECHFGLEVENNLLVRQITPMLKTNGSIAGRELYSDSFLSTVTSIINMAQSSSPMGIALVTLRTRFAGLHRPDSSIGPRDMLELYPAVNVDDEVKKEETLEVLPKV
jgi:hypothetical protein